MNIKKVEEKKLTYEMYRASISVHIPFSSLKDYHMDFKPTTNLIADKTKTHIECNELTNLEKMKFSIFGKWRDCLQAGRLLWYQLIRVTTIYVHFDWAEDLEKPLRDQRHKPFKHLYRSVKFRPLNEYNLFSISGICWDVLKVRKELLKRSASKTINEQQMISSKTEVLALQVLNCIRADINDGINSSESIYSIRNSQLLHLITGAKNPSAVDQIEIIRYPKEFVGHNANPDIKFQNLSGVKLAIGKNLVKSKEILAPIKENTTDSKQNENFKKEISTQALRDLLFEAKLKRHSLNLMSAKPAVISVKTEKPIEVKPNLVDKLQNKCQPLIKSIPQTLPEVKQIQKESNSQRVTNGLDSKVKTNEHKLIADRIQHLMNSKPKQKMCYCCNRSCSLKQQFIDSQIFDANKSQVEIKSQNQNHNAVITTKRDPTKK